MRGRRLDDGGGEVLVGGKAEVVVVEPGNAVGLRHGDRAENMGRGVGVPHQQAVYGLAAVRSVHRQQEEVLRARGAVPPDNLDGLDRAAEHPADSRGAAALVVNLQLCLASQGDASCVRRRLATHLRQHQPADEILPAVCGNVPVDACAAVLDAVPLRDKPVLNVIRAGNRTHRGYGAGHIGETRAEIHRRAGGKAGAVRRMVVHDIPEVGRHAVRKEHRNVA